MSVSVTLDGITYELPTSGDVDWGAALTSFLRAVATKVDGLPDNAITADGVATLTNKTISGADNTITNIPNNATTATSESVPNTIVMRNANGGFSANGGTFGELQTDVFVSLFAPMRLPAADETGSPGATIINAPCGRAAIAKNDSSVLIENEHVEPGDIVLAMVVGTSDDATLTHITRVDVQEGQFTVHGNAAASEKVDIMFVVFKAQ